MSYKTLWIAIKQQDRDERLIYPFFFFSKLLLVYNDLAENTENNDKYLQQNACEMKSKIMF